MVVAQSQVPRGQGQKSITGMLALRVRPAPRLEKITTGGMKSSGSRCAQRQLLFALWNENTGNPGRTKTALKLVLVFKSKQEGWQREKNKREELSTSKPAGSGEETPEGMEKEILEKVVQIPFLWAKICEEKYIPDTTDTEKLLKSAEIRCGGKAKLVLLQLGAPARGAPAKPQHQRPVGPQQGGRTPEWKEFHGLGPKEHHKAKCVSG